jgi:nuclear protein localization protein 4
VLDELLSTNGWQTLVTIATESAGRNRFTGYTRRYSFSHLAPHRPSAPAPTLSAPDSEDLPPELFNEFIEGGSGNVGSSRDGSTVCPHCTFENSHSGGDCDVCGLPLG